MRDNKPQNCDQQQKWFEVTRNATNQENTKMKHRNKILPAISSKQHVNTRRVCFPIGRFASIYLYNKIMMYCFLYFE